MDWSNERYVRVYVRDTSDILAIGWEGRALFSEILRKVDRAGIFDSDEPEVIAELIRMPADIVERALEKLVRRNIIQRVSGMLIVRNFLEAQEASASESQRSREHRARHRDKAKAGELRGTANETICDEHGVQSATKRDGVETIRDEHLGPCDENVTLCCAVPSVPSVNNAHPEAARSRSEVTAKELETVYQSYPRKKGKAPGLKKAQRLIRTREDFEKYRKCVEWMAEQWATADDSYCPYFSTFVSEQRWNDEEWPGPSQPKLNGVSTGYPPERML